MRTMQMIALTETTMPLENSRRTRVIATVAALACGLFAYSTPTRAQTTTIADTESFAVAQASSTQRAAEDRSIRPFKVQMPQAALDDLRRRINATRWPDKETVADRSQGTQLAKLQELVRYWGTDYDWRKAEAKLNALPQFITTIDGLDIHFIHVRSRHPNALPVIITHGWPGSVTEQLKVIGPLTDPTAHGGRAPDAFDVIIPSMPGYGFSGKPTEHRLEPGSHRASLGRVDETARLHALRRAGWRLGLTDLECDGASIGGGVARHSHQLAGDDTARCGCEYSTAAGLRRRDCPTRNARRSTRSMRSTRSAGPTAQ